MAATKELLGTGRRKTAVARVYMREGHGQLLINHRSLEDYFPDKSLCVTVLQPLELTNTSEKFDIVATLKGGGTSGQAEALRHGIARALETWPEVETRPVLKRAGLLKRDSRKVERKKYGRPGARKRFQYSKR